MLQRKKTTEELERIQQHLGYEVMMLVETTVWLSEKYVFFSRVENMLPICNAVVESFGIHARNTIGFLYAQGPQKEDAIAEDFFEDGRVWQRNRPPVTRLLRLSRDRIAKEIAHLTYGRLGVLPEKKPWEFLRITADIMRAFNAFEELSERGRLQKRVDWVGQPYLMRKTLME